MTVLYIDYYVERPYRHDMSGHWYDDVVTPALIRGGQQAYGHAIKKAYAAGGFDDMPRNGTWIVGGIGNNGPLDGLAGVTRDLGLSKQAVSQLVDALVLRGYVERVPATDDRRRVVVDLTDRGRAAAQASRAATASVDAALAAKIGAQGLGRLRAGLAALSELG
ncbi:MAG: MarR family winged helix-turn-helix transcriptional regulator [Mycobacteriales bacterium]